MSGVLDHASSRRRTRTWTIGLLGVAAATSLGVFLVQAHARRAPRPDATWRGLFALDEAAIPDDTLLQEQLEHAVDLRRREDFDRMLDAHDPGELIEHATLTDVVFDRRTLGIDTLFVVGDELFGYLFRPENGWGSGTTDRKAISYTPRLRRIHQGAAGGPDAFGCFSCHSKGGPDGGGMQTQNGFMRGDGKP